MPPGAWHTLAGVAAVGLFEFLLLWKIYKSLRYGVVSIDLNFLSGFFGGDAANNIGNSNLNFERAELAGIYWAAVAVLAFTAVLLGSIGILIIRFGIG